MGAFLPGERILLVWVKLIDINFLYPREGREDHEEHLKNNILILPGGE